ncbi:MAG: NAD+ synthase [Planctomycetes bacterium RIFCSPHIGHO2_02_FULL_50_42]|nr:MAG: NAD+ synthase [Planctomycetes bacterium GWA2_50_13]OHB89603.1 MAG: NAD+ synthase [Planctomycetes bacterium RIFCSPHIGHO2_02_FULL_50_42]OHB95168.1 MAG: NAD+ synthase [Planctomycetes bacterium RIFCSPLOWO2_02_FULL_50_16]OHC04173.1 MAG: NAD+ synthase [Planctomycetes bacterium RIFCSPLOWO2_12_FULL_50_35]HCN19016.1 NAD+ synthase [Planctomycetia bacterium]
MGHKKVRVAIAQINTTVGDLDGNAQKILDYVEKARAAGADIVSFPELAVCGYPPEDLLLKHAFIRDNLDALSTLVKKIGDIVAVIGFADKAGREVYNAAAVVYDKKIRKVYHKILLPNYGVFDEKRYFAPGRETPVFVMDGIVFAVNICEDIWHDEGPTRPQAKKGARLIVNINSSPYHAGKIKLRQRIVRRQAVGNKVFVSYTNLVGGQDELVFDGQSMILDNRGRRVALAKAFEEDLLVEDLDIPAQIRAKAKFFRDAVVIPKEIRYEEKPPLSKREPYCLKPLDEVYRALILGLKDYISKNGFERVIIGLSGGIDSSLTATIAVDALGRDAVCGVFMPSVYTSRESKEDVQKLAGNLGIRLETIPIHEEFKNYLQNLKAYFKGYPEDRTEENIQARIRGNILMALSNKFGHLVLNTGNKSEVSCGYCTIYGDMVGGFGVLKDVTKTLVYELARFRNLRGEVIPRKIIEKEPSPELKAGQKDSDDLPPFEVLDPILKAYVEENKSFEEIVVKGYDKEVVKRVITLVDKNEYKRRQAAPGIKITPKAFGRDRRMPIANRYKD